MSPSASRLPSNDIAPPRSGAVPIAVGDAPSSLLDVILRAGSDPAFDVEKFARLVQIQRDEQDRQDVRADREAELEAESAFNAAMADVQAQMLRVSADASNGSTKSRYASYGAMDRALRPLYAPAGFALSFDEQDCALPDHVRVICYVTHTASGARRSHTRTHHADIPTDGKGARGGDVMSKTHAKGSGFTYGKRYLLGMIFNIAVGDDDDGNRASAKVVEAPRLPDTITDAQAETIRRLLDERGIAPRAFLQFVRLARIEDIGVEHFDRAVLKIKGFGVKS